MADFNATVLDPVILVAEADPIPVVDLTDAFAPGSPLRFLMRGYRPGTADFETWTAVGAPNITNPSGLPIVDVTVVAKWTA